MTREQMHTMEEQKERAILVLLPDQQETAIGTPML